MHTSFNFQPVKDLYYLVTRLAKTRAIEAGYKRDRATLQAQIDKLIEERYGNVKRTVEESLAVAKQEREIAEDGVRLYAVQHFDGQDKKPHPAVSIGEYTVLEYDEAEALQWAREAGVCLKLDTKAFEKLAKASPLPFVTISTEPRARIATDLAEWE